MIKIVQNIFGEDNPHEIIAAGVSVLDQPTGVNCIALSEAWDKIRIENPNDQNVPYRSNLKPQHLKSILPYLIILDLIDEGEDFLVRLCGTACVDFFKQDITKKTLKETQIEGYQYRIDSYNKVLKTKKPIFLKFPTKRILVFPNLPEEEKFVYFAAFPLLDKSGATTKIILCFDFKL